jgi:hypothetical protein
VSGAPCKDKQAFLKTAYMFVIIISMEVENMGKKAILSVSDKTAW